MKRILASTLFLVLVLSGSSIASPVTLRNILSFTNGDLVSSRDGTGELISYGGGIVNQLDCIANFVKWSHSISFQKQPDLGIIYETLSLKFRNKDNSWLPQVALGGTDQSKWGIGNVRSENRNFNAYIDKGSIIFTLLSLKDNFIIDSSVLSVSYNSTPAPAPVPEPSSLILFGLAISMTGVIIRKRVTQ